MDLDTNRPMRASALAETWQGPAPDLWTVRCGHGNGVVIAPTTLPSAESLGMQIRGGRDSAATLNFAPRRRSLLIYKYRLAMFVEREEFAHLIVESPHGTAPIARWQSRESRRNCSAEVSGQDSYVILR
jgi:hypothetical protein